MAELYEVTVETIWFFKGEVSSMRKVDPEVEAGNLTMKRCGADDIIFG